MKMSNGLLGLMIVAAATVFFTQSCSKDDGGSLSDADIALAQDEAYVDALYEELDNLVVSEIITLDDNDYSNSLKSTGENICYNVTVDYPDSTTFPKIVTIDFCEGCTVIVNGDTITRSGQIVVSLTKRWFMPEAQHIATFNNFYFNGAKVEGTRTMTNLGLNERNRLQVSVALQNGKVTFGENTWMTREANHVRAWARDINPLNDTLFVTGSASGMNVLGEAYQREITEQLVLVRCAEYQWRWVIAAGQVEITNSARGNTTIDHSGSGCDGNVAVNKDGYRYNYQFRYNHRNNTGGN